MKAGRTRLPLVIITVLYVFVTTRTGAVSVIASSLIDPAVDQGLPPVGVDGTVPDDLLLALRAVTDPRARRGRRHEAVSVLGVAVCAVLAGARSYIAIAEWSRDLTPMVRARLGLGRRTPCESTIRRVLQGVAATFAPPGVAARYTTPMPPAPRRPLRV